MEGLASGQGVAHIEETLAPNPRQMGYLLKRLWRRGLARSAICYAERCFIIQPGVEAPGFRGGASTLGQLWLSTPQAWGSKGEPCL
jgi:hypothetical protein